MTAFVFSSRGCCPEFEEARIAALLQPKQEGLKASSHDDRLLPRVCGDERSRRICRNEWYVRAGRAFVIAEAKKNVRGNTSARV
jgi:hypothetical protein